MLLYYTSSCRRARLKEPCIYIQTRPHYPSVLISLVRNTKRRRSLLLLSGRCGALNTGVMSGMDPSLPLCNATPQPTDFKEESLRHRLFTLSRTGTRTCTRTRTHAGYGQGAAVHSPSGTYCCALFSAERLHYSPYYCLITTSKHSTCIQALPKPGSPTSVRN